MSNAKELEEFKKVTAKNYADQAKFFLNAFWKEHQNDAEQIWLWTQKFIELDLEKKKDGSDLDEFNAHSNIEFLLFRFNKSIKELLERPQGENPEEIRKAELKVQEAQAALDSLKKAEAELKAAIDELQAQETAYNNKIAELDRKSKDQSATVVARNKAANELAQLKQEDPLPLRKAKLTQEAALRKVEKQRLAAEAAVDEALKYLDQVRKQGGSPQGTLWWMDREMKEIQKYMPKRKQ